MHLTLTAVGVGPGDPELITVKGMRAIQSADVVFVPLNQKTGSSVALSIVEPYIQPDDPRIVPIGLQMVRFAGQETDVWQAVAEKIANQMQVSANQHDAAKCDAVYLLLGDPSIYGTFTYIAAQIANVETDLNIRVIPGITSFSAGAAAGNYPIIAMNECAAVLPLSYEGDLERIEAMIKQFDALVVMKPGKRMTALISRLGQLGLFESSLYVEKVGMPEERIIHDLSSVPEDIGPYFSLIIIRKTPLL